ncbi:MAG: helix-turn-helix domain-containing protein [Clostridiales bacterium]|nr:helix-turn-helix domain-containing protein [Clostridiales bacterium]
MFIHITTTQKNVEVYPIHTHDMWEYICYETGVGVLKTEEGDLPFKAGTVILVPPKYKHGSSAKNPFRNICIHTDLAMNIPNKLYLPCVSQELRDLFGVIERLYREKEKFLSVIESLLPALKELILKEAKLSAVSDSLVNVRNEIARKFSDENFDLAKVIAGSGYVDDVFRIKFKKVYGVTPKEYLDDLRMQSAKDFLQVYGEILSIKEIAKMCGFNDSLYFSRKFKRNFGISPKRYVKEEIGKK